jgi:hypothetical protein
LTASRRRRCTRGARLPTYRELACAPELAVLVAVEQALDVANVALVAAQSELWPSVDRRDVVSTATGQAADRIIACAQALAAAIADYRAALQDEQDDPLPF